jgi:hypothetical protein
MEEPVVSKKNKYRKDKPWDNDPTIDKWKIEPFTKGGKNYKFQRWFPLLPKKALSRLYSRNTENNISRNAVEILKKPFPNRV